MRVPNHGRNTVLRQGPALVAWFGMVLPLCVTTTNAAVPPFVLDLPGGGTLPGDFADSPPLEGLTRETFRWKSPLFATAFEFRFDAIIGVRAAAAADIRSIDRASEQEQLAPKAGTPPLIRAALQDGEVVTGNVLAVRDGMLFLGRPGGEGDIRVPLGNLVSVVSLRTAAAQSLPARPGRLVLDGACVPGCLVDAAAPGGGLAWLPAGSLMASRFVAAGAALAAEVEYARDPNADPAARPPFPAVAVLRNGDSVPAIVERIDSAGVRLRSPVTASAGREPVTVSQRLMKAIDLDRSAASRGISPAAFERLLTLPRSQQSSPPTHLVRLRNGDYLRGSLDGLDAEEVRFEVLGQMKSLPRDAVVRVIWLHPEDPAADGAAIGAALAGQAVAGQTVAGQTVAGESRGILVRGVSAAGERLTIVAERVAGDQIIGRSEAFGESRIDGLRIDRLLIGKALDRGTAELPFAKWRLRPAAVPGGRRP